MSLRRQFLLVLAAFSVALTVVSGVMVWRIASDALQRELDDKLRQVAGAAAEVGFESSALLALQAGIGDEVDLNWTSAQNRLRRLRTYVSDAWIFRRDNRSIVTTEPADSVPIGTPLRWLAAYPDELDEAWTLGRATTPLFRGDDGRFYEYGFVQLEQSDAMLAVLMSTDHLAPLARLRRIVVYGSVVAVLLSAMIAVLLAANVARPLERLSRVALRIQRGRMVRPVTEEKGVELGRLSRAMERMRVGLQSRDEQLRLMLAQVAHEIRNPLGGLELFAAAAAETDDPEERQRLLKRVRSEVSALNQIINDFLVFARPTDAGAQLCDLRATLEEATELVRIEAIAFGGTVTADLPHDPLLAYADPDHVKRVVLNLLRNGAQAAKSVTLTGEAKNGEVVLSVRDDGPGVAPELRDRIFEPFVTDKEQGAGLGLAIVKRLTEANRGRVELVDQEETNGTGTEFRVYFRGSEELPIPEHPVTR